MAGLALAYCGGTVENDESALGTNDSKSMSATQPNDAGGPIVIPTHRTPAVLAEPSFRVHEPQVVPAAPPAPTESPCPGCPPPPGATPVAPTPIDTPL